MFKSLGIASETRRGRKTENDLERDQTKRIASRPLTETEIRINILGSFKRSDKATTGRYDKNLGFDMKSVLN